MVTPSTKLEVNGQWCLYRLRKNKMFIYTANSIQSTPFTVIQFERLQLLILFWRTLRFCLWQRRLIFDISFRHRISLCEHRDFFFKFFFYRALMTEFFCIWILFKFEDTYIAFLCKKMSHDFSSKRSFSKTWPYMEFRV